MDSLFLVARYGPAGDGWSLRGNGAVTVPFGVGAALLEAGWTMIAARFRTIRRRLLLGTAASVVGLRARTLAAAVALPLTMILAFYGSASVLPPGS